MNDGSGNNGNITNKFNEMYIKIIQIEAGMSSLKSDVADLKESQKTGFVTREQFDNQKHQTERRLQLLERIVYGAVGLILTAVIVALVSLVVSSGGITP